MSGRNRMPLLMALAAVGALGLILLVWRALYVIVMLPENGIAWGPSVRWERFGSFLQGVGTVLLGVGALAGGGWALYRHFEQRGRDLALRERQTRLDVARLRREAIEALQLRHQWAPENEQAVLRGDLAKSALLHQHVIEGFMLDDIER